MYTSEIPQTEPTLPYRLTSSNSTTETIPDINPDATGTQTGMRPQSISFVIPVKDEAATLRELRDRILAMVPVGCDVEIIFIDDGSSDNSWQTIRKLTDTTSAHVRGLRFRRNQGKAAALTAGFRAATGEVVFTMDADLQDDPAEICAMLEKLDEGYDIVSGWKKVRHDPWHKVLPSRVFNWMVSRVCGVPLHDHNCGFKCYRGEVTRRLTLHGELHRMIPSLAKIDGFRTAEVPVRHHPRRHGQSKYGFERYLRGFFDMLTVGFMQRFRERPAHLIGQIALIHFILGGALLLTGLMIGGNFAGMTLALLGGVLAAATFPIFVCGLVSELVIRGGLASNWELPIVEDTSFPGVGKQSDSAMTGPCPVSSSYSNSQR
jgi:glycosyltransferase involved in cell wall biosynthesis